MPMIDKACEVCGKTFQIDATRLRYGRGKTCSTACSYQIRAAMRRTQFATVCKRCGKEFMTTPSRVARGAGQFCSRECRHPPMMRTCQHCQKTFRVSPSAADALFCSPRCANTSTHKSQISSIRVKAAWQDPAKRERIHAGIKRRSTIPAWRDSPYHQKGDINPTYKGNRKAREGISQQPYRNWRTAVFKRDNYTCQECGKRGSTLNAHHIQQWSTHPELRYDVSNGQTLCEPCHDKLHGKERKPKTYECISCGKRKRDGRSARCQSCARKYGAAQNTRSV